jgi:Flp pilus assembly protein CpaB
LLSNDPNAITSTILHWSFWSGKQIPVLFIDEAHKLKHIQGKAAVRTILNWSILNTKQLEQMHVVMASSDSFFLDFG